MDSQRIEELESKDLLTLEEFKELGHYRMVNRITNNWNVLLPRL